jgi:iron-sulfur cluster repair protein YtfE (RIC family)
MTTRTEPLRAEHRELLPRLQELRATAASLGASAPHDVRTRLEGVVHFLREHLVPHAQAEEAVLYPAVERVMGAPGAMATMVADHSEVVTRIERLARTAARLSDAPTRTDQFEDLREQLYGLWAILLLHFGKEEEVLLPVLDASLSEADADALFAGMETTAHGQ